MWHDESGILESSEALGSIVLGSARRHPDRTALWVDNCAVSYREFTSHAAGIAVALGGASPAGPPRFCAVLGSRSLSAFAGILGAVLARAAYVPLNPRHPVERLLFALEAAEADAIIVDERSEELARHLLPLVERRLLVLMPDAVTAPGWAGTLPRHEFLCRRDLERGEPRAIAAGNPHDGAYLLFTSGSTGTPKGVLVRQRNVTAYLRSAAERYLPQPEDRFTQLFDLTFDLSAHDMFLCWSAGAALYCPPEGVRWAPREFVRRHDLTFWFSVPSTAAFMSRLHMLRPGDLPSLRWSLFCGEALPKRIAQAWAAAAPNSVVENLYGPTEATIAITAYRLPSDPALLAHVPDVLPIGIPFPGQDAIVQRIGGGLASSGEDGELCLGGSQVTDGYWRQPDLTAERFVPLPGTGPGIRWYRTGDRAKATAEHGLVFLGRMDRQVKIAGHRAELQEVEEALRHAADCDTVAAIAWPIDADGLARGIVAFVTEKARTSEAILDVCRRLLPPFMVPSSVHRVADWPVSDNGKTDYARFRCLL